MSRSAAVIIELDIVFERSSKSFSLNVKTNSGRNEIIYI